MKKEPWAVSCVKKYMLKKKDEALVDSCLSESHQTTLIVKILWDLFVFSY